MRFALLALLSLLALPPLWCVWLARSEPHPDPAAFVAAAVTSPPTIDAYGRVVLDEGHVAHVRSPGYGRVVRIDASPGDHVAAGALLAVVEGRVEDPTWARYCAAETALRLDRAAAFARCMPDRAPRRRSVVTAPAEGIVLRSTAVLNAQVDGPGTNDGPDLFVVGDEARWAAETEVGEHDAPRVLQGAPVRVHVAASPGVTFAGEVAHVSAVDPATHVAKVICTVTTRGLAAGAYAFVEIPVAPQAQRHGSAG
jgi:hypothetical protein